MTEIPQKNAGTKVFVAEFENIFANAIIIAYNETVVEIPGMVIFQKSGGGSVFNALLSPGIDIVPIEEKQFAEMLKSLKQRETDSDVISFANKTTPAKQIILNLSKLANEVILLKTFNDTIVVNDMTFTDKATEFHGVGMFTSRKAFLVDFQQLSQIKKAVKA